MGLRQPIRQNTLISGLVLVYKHPVILPFATAKQKAMVAIPLMPKHPNHNQFSAVCKISHFFPLFSYSTALPPLFTYQSYSYLFKESIANSTMLPLLSMAPTHSTCRCHLSKIHPCHKNTVGKGSILSCSHHSSGTTCLLL